MQSIMEIVRLVRLLGNGTSTAAATRIQDLEDKWTSIFLTLVCIVAFFVFGSFFAKIHGYTGICTALLFLAWGAILFIAPSPAHLIAVFTLGIFGRKTGETRVQGGRVALLQYKDTIENVLLWSGLILVSIRV